MVRIHITGNRILDFSLLVNEGLNVFTFRKTLTAIPYNSWANRGKGEMMVWFPVSVKDVDLISNESKTAIQQK